MNLWRSGKGYPLYETYKPVYFRMDSPRGAAQMPSDAPADAKDATNLDLESLSLESGWKRENGYLVHSGGAESAAFLGSMDLHDFDLWAEVEGKQDLILGAFLKGSPMNAGRDYIGFFGGYENTRTRMRIFGDEVGESGLTVSPGRHTIQLTRRNGEVWFLVDGKAVAYSKDPNPNAKVDRIAVLGGYNGNQRLYQLRLRR